MGELGECGAVVQQIFQDYDQALKGELNAHQLHAIHSDMRLGGISIPQVEAAIEYTCVGSCCEQSELFEVLKEMDRRYFLVQDLRWEFTMLDTEQRDAITEDQAKWFIQAVHGKYFSRRKWEMFLRLRAVPGSGVTFAEIEVMLCNVPSIKELMEEEESERRELEDRERKQIELERKIEEEKERRKKQREEDRKKKEELEKKRRLEEDKRKKEEEEDRKMRQKEKDEEEKRRKKLEDEEERGRREAEERARREKEQKEREEEEKKQELLEAQRLKELEERHRREEEERKKREEDEAINDEEVLKKAIQDEKDAENDMEKAKGKLQSAKDSRLKKEAEEDEKRAKLKQKESRNKRIRYNLKVAVKKRDMDKLPNAVDEFKKAKLPDDDMDLQKAERILKEAMARDGLNKAMDKRQLKELESAINLVKRSGFEVPLAKEMIEANKVLLQLRRLERIRAEILELKQSTVAEIRSYQKPPPIVHKVMTATFLILGHKEKDTKNWKNVQALVGKTGKEGLKRCCLGCEPKNIDPVAATRAKALLSEFDLEDVRDVSAGAATFYVWSMTMIEEVEALEETRNEEKKKKGADKGADGGKKKK